MKILLAVDGSVGSDVAIQEVARRPWPPCSEVKVISVCEPLRIPRPEQWVFTEPYYEQMESTAIARTHALTKQAAQQISQWQGEQLKVTSEVFTTGNPKEVILETARQWGADWIVLGSHGLKGWQRRWLGPVAQAVATLAPCSVEIVRGHLPRAVSPISKGMPGSDQ